MQEQHFSELKDVLSSELSALIPERGSPEFMRPKVAKILDQMAEDNKLLSLPTDEFNLLVAYRNWKASPDAVGGVFHWRRKS